MYFSNLNVFWKLFNNYNNNSLRQMKFSFAEHIICFASVPNVPNSINGNITVTLDSLKVRPNSMYVYIYIF